MVDGDLKVSVHVSKSRQELKINLISILDNELHLPEDGCMQHDCIRMLENLNFDYPIHPFQRVFDKVKYKRDSIVCSIAYVNGNAVGALLLCNFDLQYYVKPEFRKKGIATKLFNETKRYHNLTFDILNRADSEEGIVFAAKNAIPTTIKEMHQHRYALRNAICFIRDF